MLDNFFRICLPYGIARNDKDEWMAFNREYLPLGYNDGKMSGDPGISFLDLPVYTKYKKLTDKLLTELADSPDAIQRDEDGTIGKVFLYNDGTNPLNQIRDKPELWNRYFTKLKMLSKLSIR